MDMISGLRYAAAAETSDPSAEVAKAFALEGKTAVVTGAAMGIGRQTAITYAAAGAHVVIADRAEDALQETLETITGAGETRPPSRRT